MLDHSNDWINEIYLKIIKLKRNDMKLLAILHRYSKKDLIKFNTSVFKKQAQTGALPINIMDMPGVGYTRTGKKK